LNGLADTLKESFIHLIESPLECHSLWPQVSQIGLMPARLGQALEQFDQRQGVGARSQILFIEQRIITQIGSKFLGKLIDIHRTLRFATFVQAD
jgi:hypothetical protein